VSVSSIFRAEIIERATSWAEDSGVPRYPSRSPRHPTPMFEPYVENGQRRHGNFHDASYEAILNDAHWGGRMTKPHLRPGALPDRDRKAPEVGSAASSDALLLNLFCHPVAADLIAHTIGTVGSRVLGLDLARRVGRRPQPDVEL